MAPEDRAEKRRKRAQVESDNPADNSELPQVAKKARKSVAEPDGVSNRKRKHSGRVNHDSSGDQQPANQPAGGASSLESKPSAAEVHNAPAPRTPVLISAPFIKREDTPSANTPKQSDSATVQTETDVTLGSDAIEAAKVARQRLSKLQAQLHEIIPDQFKTPPGAQIWNLWYGIVKYKDYLTGTSTQTVFDKLEIGPLHKGLIMELGKVIRDELVAQLPDELHQGQGHMDLLSVMVECQTDQIKQLEHHASASHVGGPPAKCQRVDNSEVKEVEEEHDSESSSEEEDDSESSSSEDEETASTQALRADAPRMPNEVNRAFQAVKAQVVRVGSAEWDTPHAAVVWGLAISEDLAVATEQLREALTSQRP